MDQTKEREVELKFKRVKLDLGYLIMDIQDIINELKTKRDDGLIVERKIAELEAWQDEIKTFIS